MAPSGLTPGGTPSISKAKRCVPAGAPGEVVSRLNAATEKALQLPVVRERLAPQGLDVVGGSAEAFAKVYREDYEKYGRLVRELAISVN